MSGTNSTRTDDDDGSVVFERVRQSSTPRARPTKTLMRGAAERLFARGFRIQAFVVDPFGCTRSRAILDNMQKWGEMAIVKGFICEHKQESNACGYLAAGLAAEVLGTCGLCSSESVEQYLNTLVENQGKLREAVHKSLRSAPAGVATKVSVADQVAMAHDECFWLSSSQMVRHVRVTLDESAWASGKEREVPPPHRNLNIVLQVTDALLYDKEIAAHLDPPLAGFGEVPLRVFIVNGEEGTGLRGQGTHWFVVVVQVTLPKQMIGTNSTRTPMRKRPRSEVDDPQLVPAAAPKVIVEPKRQNCTVKPVFEEFETGNTIEVKWPGVNINTVSIISVTKINPPTYELSFLDGSRWDIATASDVKPKSSSSTIQPGDLIMARWKDEKGFHRARVTMVHNDPRNLCEVRATGRNVDDNSETILLSSEALQLMRVVDDRGVVEVFAPVPSDAPVPATAPAPSAAPAKTNPNQIPEDENEDEEEKDKGNKEEEEEDEGEADQKKVHPMSRYVCINTKPAACR